MIRFLVESGADVHAKMEIENLDAREVALDAKHTDIAEYLEREMAKR